MSYELTKTPIIINSFLSQNEIKSILQFLEKNYHLDNDKNYYLPYKYHDLDLNQKDIFFNKTNDFLSNFDNSLLEMIFPKIEKLFEDKCFYPLSALYKDYTFNPFTLRILQAGKIDIHHHIEIQSVEYFKSFFDLIKDKVDVQTQYSFVLMIQEPDFGGEIIIYDEQWKGMQYVDKQRDMLVNLEKENNAKHKISHSINLKKGDLLIFPAGKYWHKVNQTKGNTSRITLGGFISPVNDLPNEYVFWS